MITPSDREHVLQGGFGTNLVLKDEVCGACNSAFARLDDRLVKFVRGMLHWDHPDVKAEAMLLQQGLGLFLEGETGTWISIRFDRRHGAVIPPQLILLGDNKVRLTADPRYEDALAVVSAELAQEGGLEIKVQLWTPRVPPVQPALIRTARCVYLLRAQDQSIAERLRAAALTGELLRDLVIEGRGAGASHNPSVQMMPSIDFGSIERGIAKTAMNFACKVLGSELSRHEVFHPLKQFIVGPYHDEGFVKFLFGPDVPADTYRFAANMGVRGYHTLFLSVPDGVPLVVVLLYGQPFALVFLTKERCSGLIDMQSSAIGRFDYRDGSHEIVRLVDDVERVGGIIMHGQN